MTSLIIYTVIFLLQSHPIGQSKAIVSSFLRALTLSFTLTLSAFTPTGFYPYRTAI